MRSVIIAVVLVAAILSVSFSNGCDTSSQNNELTHMPEWATDMMRIVPRNATIAAFWDIRTIRSNAVWQDYYASKKSVYEAITDLDMFVGFNQLDYWAVAKDLSLVKGNFNLVDITESLGNNGWVSDEYEGIEVWTNEEMEGDLIALFSDYIITGTEESVTEAIETFNGDHPSLYEDD